MTTTISEIDLDNISEEVKKKNAILIEALKHVAQGNCSTDPQAAVAEFNSAV